MNDTWLKRSTGGRLVTCLFVIVGATMFARVAAAQEEATDDLVLGTALSSSRDGAVSVTTVEEGSAAAQAGLRKGDVILTVNKSRVLSAEDLAKTLRALRVGERASLEIQRGQRTLAVVIVGPKTAAVPTRVGVLGALLRLGSKGQVLVAEVSPGTPAEAAGLAPGDVLLSVAGYEPDTVDNLVDYMRRLVAGRRNTDEVRITVLRGDEELELTLALPSQTTPGGQPPAEGQNPGQNQRTIVLGVTVAETDNGLVITEVLEGSPAEQAGIQQGDAILAVSSRKVPTFAELREAVQAFRPGEKVEVSILREGKAFVVNTAAMATQVRLPDVALSTGASDLGAPAVELEEQVRQLQARVDELSAIVEALAKEVQSMRRGR